MMTGSGEASGDVLFEAFVEQVRQVLDHLYDFAFLQQHPLARIYDSESDSSARIAGRKLRQEVMTHIELLKSDADTPFRAAVTRLYNLLHLYYIENVTIQEVAGELGLSDRQVYRDLKRAQERVAAVMWNNRHPAQASVTPEPAIPEFSVESEIARLKLHFRPGDIGDIFREARNAVARLAMQQSVQIDIAPHHDPMILSVDTALAHQVMVSVLSHAIQQAQPGHLSVTFTPGSGFVSLILRYRIRDEARHNRITETPIPTLVQRLFWAITCEDTDDGERKIVLHMASGSTRILVIDDSEGWVELLDRFLKGFNCQVIPAHRAQESLHTAQTLHPDAIILDVMMPEKDGWEILQRLRAQPATASIPIMVCSVFNDPELAYSLGAAAFVPKPASRDDILDALRHIGVLHTPEDRVNL